MHMIKQHKKTHPRWKGCLLAIGMAAVAQLTSHAALDRSQLNISYYSGFATTFTVQGGSAQTVWATAFLAQQVGGDPLPDSHADNPFVTFCLDVNNRIANGWWEPGGFSPEPTQSSPALRQANSLFRAANLYEHYVGPTAILPGGGPVGGWSSATAQQKLEGAALQLAIWEVLYETAGSFDVDNGAGFDVGTVMVNPSLGYTRTDLISRANAMLGAYSAADTSILATFWNAVNPDALNTDRASQDLIGPYLAPVPEPGTYVAGALLLLPLLVGAIRRKRQAA
jgi:hypothetical protein